MTYFHSPNPNIKKECTILKDERETKINMEIERKMPLQVNEDFKPLVMKLAKD